MNGQNKIAINIKPSESLPSKKPIGFVKDVEEAGFIELDPVEQAGISQFLPQGFSGEQLTLALNLYSRGVRSEDFEKKIDRSLETFPGLSDKQTQSLYAPSYLIAAFEAYDPNRSISLQSTFKPEISISQVPETNTSSQNQFVFERKEGFFQPLVRELAGRGVGLAKKKVKDFAIKAIEKGGKKLAKAALKKGAGIALKAGVRVAAQALGTTVPVIGNIVAFVATEVLPRIIKFFTKAISGILRAITGEKDRRKQLFLLAGASSLILFGLGLPVAALVALAIAVAAGAAFLGAGAIVAGAGATMSFVLALGTVAVSAFVVPLLVALIAIPLVVVFIIFIINSGAYVVPYNPSTLVTAFDNPYVRIEKTATPGEVDNPPPSRSIEYQVTVTALQGTLTNISFSDSCEVFGDSAGVPCPVANTPLPPSIVSPAEPFTFSYQTSIGSSITDSIVVDTFTVNADAPEAPGQSNSSSASVIVGEPPLDCLVPSDNALPWPAASKSNLLSAITRLVSQQPAFVAKVCAGGEVPLCYNPPAVSYWGYHVHGSSCDILFSAGGFRNSNNATFILAHELSHHMDRINGTWFRAYLDSGAPSEAPICSYIASYDDSEGFAEGNALYVQLPSYWSSQCSGTYQSLYPLHYNFARGVIF